MTSIEGKRGEPRPRPPSPVKRLLVKATILNVETYANIPVIFLKARMVYKHWYRKTKDKGVVIGEDQQYRPGGSANG